MKRIDVERVLVKIGVPVDLLGFDHITDVVLLINQDATYKGKMMNLYEDMSEKFETTPSRVERAIRHAFARARELGNIETVNYIGSGKSNNKSSLFLLHKMIELEILKQKGEDNNG